MKKKRSIFITLILTGIFIQNLSIAQSEWDEILKNENGLIVSQKQEVNISVDEQGNLNIIADIYESTRHFSNNANIYSEQSVGYSDAFTEISNIEAYSFVPNEKGKFRKIKVDDFVTSDSRSDGIFYDDQKKISFVFPALKEGSETVLSYTKKYREPRLWGYYVFSSFDEIFTI